MSGALVGFSDRERALVFATIAHRQQNRKYTGESYICHPIMVASWVSSVPHTDEMIMAAYLHDVVEDTEVTLQMIEEEFGKDVVRLVEALTDVSKPSDGNRAQRKLIDLQHTATAPVEAKTIKLADLIDNTHSIKQHDKDFWKVYRKEKLALLEVLTDGDQDLWQEAYNICKE